MVVFCRSCLVTLFCLQVVRFVLCCFVMVWLVACVGSALWLVLGFRYCVSMLVCGWWLINDCNNICRFAIGVDYYYLVNDGLCLWALV